jgi:hypothetical protein
MLCFEHNFERGNKMTFWETLGIVLSSAGLFASILGAFLTYAARQNGAATRELIRTMEERMTEILDRMDKRSDERHREVVEAIRAIKAA